MGFARRKHAEQRLTLSVLRTGWLSTLRFTLLAPNGFDYDSGGKVIDQFMDELSVVWMPTTSKAAASAIESAELSGEFHYPLNIQRNRAVELSEYIRFVSQIRMQYKQRF